MLIVSLCPAEQVDEEEHTKGSGKRKHLHYLKNHLKKEWDSLLWIFATFFILYFFEFGSNLLFNPRIDR